MPEVIVTAIPDNKQFGRAAKLRLDPNNIADLVWEIPENFPTHPVCSDPEISEVTEVVPKAKSQDTMTPLGESFMTTELVSWFQSLTDQFIEELNSQVTLSPSRQPFYVPINPCKYIENQWKAIKVLRLMWHITFIKG